MTDMCWCDDFDFTINRADEYMVRQRTKKHYYVVSPPTIIALVEIAVERGELSTRGDIDHLGQRLVYVDLPSCGVTNER